MFDLTNIVAALAVISTLLVGVSSTPTPSSLGGVAETSIAPRDVAGVEPGR